MDETKKNQEYDEIVGAFRDGIARVKTGRYYSFINEAGQLITDMRFPAAWDFQEGFALVRIELPDEKEGYAFLDKAGKLLGCWEEEKDFKDAEGRVKNNGKYVRHLWGVLMGGRIWEKAESFRNGVARVGENGKYGLLDTSGNLLCPCMFGFIGDFEDGTAWVATGISDSVKDYVRAFPDENGKLQTYGLSGAVGKNGYIKPNGEVLGGTLWDYIQECRDGRSIVIKDKKYGVMDKSGKLVVPCQWEFAWEQEEGIGYEYSDGKGGVIDSSGNVIDSWESDPEES